MINYEETVQKIIDSIINFSFEFDIEIVKKEMELQEVSKADLEKLGKDKVKEKFDKGIFKIKMPNGNLIDYKYSLENNIKKPSIFINSDIKYVQWIIKKDFTTTQIKKQIKKQLTGNNEINYTELQKALLIEDTKNKEIVGYINELPIKTSDYINQGEFYIQSSCTRESAIKIVNDVIEELKNENKIYVKDKIRRDYKNICLYLIFVILISSLWFVNKQYQTLPSWLSNTIGLFLFLIPLVVMRLINHSIFDTLFYRKKAEQKYEKEFKDKVIL